MYERRASRGYQPHFSAETAIPETSGTATQPKRSRALLIPSPVSGMLLWVGFYIHLFARSAARFAYVSGRPYNPSGTPSAGRSSLPRVWTFLANKPKTGHQLGAFPIIGCEWRFP